MRHDVSGNADLAHVVMYSGSKRSKRNLPIVYKGVNERGRRKWLCCSLEPGVCLNAVL